MDNSEETTLSQEIVYYTEQQMLSREKRDCPNCRGTGKLLSDRRVPLTKADSPCTCGGTGKLKDNRIIDELLIKGVPHGLHR